MCYISYLKCMILFSMAFEVYRGLCWIQYNCILKCILKNVNYEIKPILSENIFIEKYSYVIFIRT
jgi:hypothetical protein